MPVQTVHRLLVRGKERGGCECLHVAQTSSAEQQEQHGGNPEVHSACRGFREDLRE